MKISRKIFTISAMIVALLLSGCNAFSGSESNNNSTTIDSSDTTDGSQGNSSNQNYQDTTIRILATNDIHGQIYPEPDAYRVGVGKLMTFVKNMKENNENVFLIDSGDTWQGSIYSNYNHGQCITDIMNYVHYDARTIGNHDFDWGVDAIKANTKREYNGYKTPVLGANIYDFNFDTKTVGTTQQIELGAPSVTYSLNNGMKVGIVGAIGKDQITSINSLYTRGIAFTDHINAIKNEATKLRNDGCQFVICSLHAGQGDAINHNLGEYVDLVLCGHTHRQERYEENGLLFAQFGQYTEGVGYIELKYDASTKKVSFDRETAKMYKYNDINREVENIDPTIQNIMNKYTSECEEKANIVYANNVSGDFYSDYQAANLMCNAIYDFAIKEGYDIDLAYCNLARHDLYQGSWTYANIFEAFPFDNVVYIIDIPASEYISEIVAYNHICKSKNESIVLNGNKTLKVACLDYLAWHNNSNRYYDYFPSVAQYDDPSDVPTLSKTYREILCDWLVENHYNEGNNVLRSDDYLPYLRQFDKNDCEYANVNITYHLYDDVVITDEVPWLSRFESVQRLDVKRTNYEFVCWCFDPELNNPCGSFKVDHDIDVYAKWRESDSNYNYYTTAALDYLDFIVDSTSTTATAVNDQGASIDVVIDHSTIFDNSQYQEFSIAANGYFHINIPTGYTLYSFSVDQFRYHNLEFYESDSVNSEYLLNIGYATPQTDHSVYSATGLALTDLYIYNTYSGKISFFSMQFTFAKVS